MLGIMSYHGAGSCEYCRVAFLTIADQNFGNRCEEMGTGKTCVL
jgi:hypothetical protein